MHLVKSTNRLEDNWSLEVTRSKNHLIETIWFQWELALLKLVSYY